MKIAVVGATGLVGRKILEILEERCFSVDELILAASERSIGKLINFKGKDYPVISIANAVKSKPDIALFSAGGATSLDWAEKFAENKTYVVDNSSAWRMDKTKKLIVPEVNGKELTKEDFIIANPNCSTIQLVVALAPLHKIYKIKRVVVSTYQSVSGSGQAALTQLENERNNTTGNKKYPYQIDKNCIPHCDDFNVNGYTKEELKLTNETKKILSDNSIHITATAVRVPVTGGHSESVNIEFEKDYVLNDIKQLLEKTKGIVVVDNPEEFKYPMPLFAFGKDEVFVGRLRRDYSNPNTLNMWIVADNLRKGAATNAIQIAEYLKENFL
jgi:aspartate-semialdehyde dehydrogenase